jgi:hypothetical protein
MTIVVFEPRIYIIPNIESSSLNINSTHSKFGHLWKALNNETDMF